jgi:hypothetical protein
LLVIALLLPSVSIAQDNVTEDSSSPTNVTVDTSSTTTGSGLPLLDEVSSAQGSFRQMVVVGNSRTFDEAEVLLFQSLYSSFTVSYALTEADVENGEITTECIVTYMELVANITSISNATASEDLDPAARHMQEEDEELPIEGFFIDYTMNFESQYDDVSHYDILFQNWINVNLELVVERLQTLNFNVTEIQTASRLIKTEPTEAPSSSGTGTLFAENGTNTPTVSPTNPPTQRRNTNGTAIILSSLFLGICIVVAGLLIYWRKHRSVGSQKNDHGRRATSEIRNDDVEKAMDTADGNDKHVRIQEPTPSSSSTSSKDDDHKEHSGHHKEKHDGGNTPTSGEHYDDWVHHYYKKKNEKKEKKKRRSSSKTHSLDAGTAKTTKTSSRPHSSSRRESRDPTTTRASSHHRNNSHVSTSSMKTSLQKLEDQRALMSEEEFEERRRQILLAALH